MMKHQKIMWLLVLTFLLLNIIPAFADKSASEIAARMEKSIVLVQAGKASGTGFFIGKEGENPQFVITNYHVVENLILDKTFDKAQIYYSFNDSEYGSIVAYTEEKDLAVIRLLNPTDKRIPIALEKTENIEVGMEVYSLGYPGIDRVGGATQELFVPSFRMGRIARIGLKSYTRSGGGLINTESITYDLDTFSGNSGGPIVDNDGYLVSIVHGAQIQGSNSLDVEESKWGIHVSELALLLNNKGIPFDYGKQNSFANNLPFFIGGALALCAIIYLLTSILSKSRKNAGKNIPGNNVQEQSAFVTGNSMIHGQNLPASYMECTAGDYTGKCFELRAAANDAGYIIGRDPQRCKISFAQYTNGVSKVHCCVRYSNSNRCFTVQDLHSTYGTYVNGAKLPSSDQAMALNNGDKICLGSDHVAFKVHIA